jgi:hypothetical protein
MTERKTKDYQAVVFTYTKQGAVSTRESSELRAADSTAAREKMEKKHGASVDPETGRLMWTVGRKPGS